MYKREDFEIGVNDWNPPRKWFYIKINDNKDKCLWKDGTINYGTGFIGANKSFRNALGYWDSRESAEQYLDKFLKEQNMNLKAKREQCIADIGVLQSNLAELDKEINKQKETFKRGQWFKNKCGDKFMLTQIGLRLYALVHQGGNRQQDGIVPSSESYLHTITWDDLDKMYYNAKKELTPIKVIINEVS